MSLLVSPRGRREAVVSARRALPRSAPRPAAARRAVPPWWAETVLVLGLYGAYVLTRGMQSANAADADRTGWAILHWEQRWHLAIESSLNVGLGHLVPVAVLSGYFYATLHFVITPGVLVFLYRRHPDAYRRARTALGLATATALIGYFLLPTAPPRLLTGGGFEDTLASVSNWGWWGGEGSAPRGLGGLTNQLAAMPSLHVGWALWSGWYLARLASRRPVRVLGAVYPVLTTLVVISTANHYVLDAVVGSLLVVLAWAAVAGFTVLRRRMTPVDVARVPAPRTPVVRSVPDGIAVPQQPSRQDVDEEAPSRPCVSSPC